MFFFVSRLDYLLNSWDYPDFGFISQFWGVFKKSYHLQKMQKSLQTQFISFESGLKHEFLQFFQKMVTSKVVHTYRGKWNRLTLF